MRYLAMWTTKSDRGGAGVFLTVNEAKQYAFEQARARWIPDSVAIVAVEDFRGAIVRKYAIDRSGKIIRLNHD